MDNDELLIAIGGMFNKKVDEIKSELAEHRSHTGVIIESLRSDIKAIAEGHSVLDNKIDCLKKDLSDTKKELKEDVSGLKKDVSGLKKDVSGLKKDVSGLKKDVSGLKKDVSGLKKDVSGLKEDVDSLKKDTALVKKYVIAVDTKLNEHDAIIKRVK